MKKGILILIAILGMASSSMADMWTQKADFGVRGRFGAIGFSIGDNGYIGIGYDTVTSSFKDFWKYDSNSDTWTQLVDFGGGYRNDAVGFSINNKGYIATGHNSTGYFNDLWEYDTIANSWTQKANFGGVASCFVIDTIAYVGLGFNNSTNTYFNDLWAYNPASNSWTQKSNFNGAARSNAISFSIGTKGYFGCGESNLFTNYYNDFWEYDPSGNTWTQKSNVPGIRRADAIGFSIGQMGYAGLGDSAHVIFYDFWEYNPINDSWLQKINFPGAHRASPVGFSIGTKGFIGTGFNFSLNNYKDLWEYDPNGWAGIQESSLPIIKTTLAPNPFTDKTTLTIEGNPQNISLNIFNIQGQIVKSIPVGNKKEILVTREGLAQGMYFYELVEDGITIPTQHQILATGKIVIE